MTIERLTVLMTVITVLLLVLGFGRQKAINILLFEQVKEHEKRIKALEKCVR
jgi:hypothetical protein